MSAQPAIDLIRLAELARLSGELEAVPLDDTPAMVRAGAASGIARADEPQPSLPREALLARAPKPEDDFYSVPKTVGGEG
jgi:aspartyl-tRNA(Asn)/glutamyl-tRNA(Gln) amidotransferase subunit C